MAEADDEELIRLFDVMVSEECDRNEAAKLFEGWNDEAKARYMKQLAFNLPQHDEAANLENMEVPVRIYEFLFAPFAYSL
jgi:hypothetical protein